MIAEPSAPSPITKRPTEFGFTAENPSQPAQPGDTIVKNKAVWSLSVGTVARHISETEFAQCDTLSGIIIEDGVEAIINVDGQQVAQMGQGMYNFVSSPLVERVRQQPVPHREGGLVGAVKKMWGGLVNLIFGKKVSDVKTEHLTEEQKRVALTDDLIRKMTANTIISAYLKLNREFPVLFGSAAGLGGKPEFRPMDIRTKYVDVKVGVSMFLQIYDAKAFLSKYMVGRKCLTIQDIQEELMPYVREIVQREMSDCTMEGNTIPADVQRRIIDGLLRLTDAVSGVRVVRVVDVTAQNADLERFRQLAAELYISEKELDFLARTNEFKNRLAAEENAQRIREARGLYEQHLALQEINRDKLLSDDEMRRFEQELQTRVMDRDNNTEAERLTSLATLAMRKMDIAARIEGHQLQVEADLADVKFEKYSRERANDMKELEIEEQLYGRQYIIQKQHLADAIELDRVKRGYAYQTEVEDQAHQGELLREQLRQRGLVDDYEDGRLDKEFGRKISQATQLQDLDARGQMQQQDLAARAENQTIDQIERKQSIAMDRMSRLAQIDQQMKDAQHRREMERETMAHEERMEAQQQEFQIRMAQADNYTRMSAEQIAASQLQNLDAHQADAFKGVYGSQRDVAATERVLEAERQAAAMAARNAQDMVALSERARQDSRQDMKDIMAMAMGQMQAMQAMQQQHMQERLDDAREMKQEYRDEMHHNQERIDANQQQSLDYTTRENAAVGSTSINNTGVVEVKK